MLFNCPPSFHCWNDRGVRSCSYATSQRPGLKHPLHGTNFRLVVRSTTPSSTDVQWRSFYVSYDKSVCSAPLHESSHPLSQSRTGAPDVGRRTAAFARKEGSSPDALRGTRKHVAPSPVGGRLCVPQVAVMRLWGD
jgi:hypothetical protein